HTATAPIYTLSLHDALPIYSHSDLDESRDEAGRADEAQRVLAQDRISRQVARLLGADDRSQSVLPEYRRRPPIHVSLQPRAHRQDRKSTRLNSSHVKISYAV